MRHDHEINHWHDRRIVAGECRRDEIAAAIEASDFGLLCITPAYLASRHVTEVELPALLERGVAIAVVLEAGDFNGVGINDLHRTGIRDLDVFRYRPSGTSEPRALADCAGASASQFCDALVARMAEQLRTNALG